MDLSIVLILILSVLEFCRCGTSLPSSWAPGRVSSIGALLKTSATRNMYQCEWLCRLTSPCASASFSVTTRLCSLYRDVPVDSDISSSRTDVVLAVDKQDETMLIGACRFYRCPDGRVCVATGDSHICLIAGVSCGPPASLVNANVTYTTTTFNPTVVYTCHVGYVFEGRSDQAVCSADGRWEELDGECILVLCGPPASEVNANITYTTTTFNSTAVYICHVGYVFEGISNQAVCSADGRWEGLDGDCTISCGPPASIVNADVTYTTTTFNSTAVYTCHVGYFFKGGNRQAVCSADGQWEGLDGECIKPQDCLDILNANNSSTDGDYTINPTGASPINVYCDMTDDGGGWTVFQRRTEGSLSFFRIWAKYKQGFGTPSNEFWLGNNNIYEITNQKVYSLKVDLEDFDNNKRHASYSHFYIDDESLKYKLHITGYSGDAGDSLASHDQMKFTTRDQDNDVYDFNCAKLYHGAWWYTKCHHSNLNGEYNSTEFGKGLTWYSFKGYYYSLKYTAMKIRPT